MAPPRKGLAEIEAYAERLSCRQEALVRRDACHRHNAPVDVRGPAPQDGTEVVGQSIHLPRVARRAVYEVFLQNSQRRPRVIIRLVESLPARELQAVPLVQAPQLEPSLAQLEPSLEQVPPGRRPVDAAEGAARRRERAEAARPTEGRRELERVAREERLYSSRERSGRRRLPGRPREDAELVRLELDALFVAVEVDHEPARAAAGLDDALDLVELEHDAVADVRRRPLLCLEVAPYFHAAPQRLAAARRQPRLIGAAGLAARFTRVRRDGPAICLQRGVVQFHCCCAELESGA